MNQPRTCRQCGGQIEAGAKFCPYCGFNNASAAQAQQGQNNGFQNQAGGQSPPGQQQRQNIQPPPGGHPPYNSGVPQGGANMQSPPGQQQRQNMQPPPGGHPPYNSGVPQGGANMQNPPGQQQRQNIQPQSGGYSPYNGGVTQGNNQYSSYQGYQTGGRGNMPPSYPQQQSRKSPVGIIIVLLLVLIAGGAFAYKTLGPGKNVPVGAGVNTPPASNQQDSVKGVAQNDLSKPETYLPQPNLKITYHEIYPDGDEGYLDLVTANIISNAEVSDVSMFTDGNGDVYGGVCHYIKKSDGGIYYIFDDDPSFSYSILPGNLQAGASWVYSSGYGDIAYTIQQLGATCTLGCGTFKDCLVVEADNKVFDIRELSYYAPGMGEILRQSVPDGTNVYELTSYQSIDAAEAQSILLQYSYNHEQVNSQISGQ